MFTMAPPFCSRMIAAAERPVLLIGNGCARTRVTKQLNRFVDETGIYAAMTFMAKGVISDVEWARENRETVLPRWTEWLAS